MSYLNALASDGLSVGLRFYTAKLNEKTSQPPVVSAPAEAVAPEKTEEPGSRPKAPAPRLNPEEAAAGRAEAHSRLAADAAIGRLQARGRDEALADDPADDPAEEPQEQAGQSADLAADPRRLTPEEQKQVDEMQRRDREVRAHEQAHIAAAAGLAGAPVYEFQIGPDGRRYAVGGHVEVKTSGSSNPDQALREAEAVKRAATAPADPSGADQAAAARATAEINRLKAERASCSLDEYSGQKDGQTASGQAGEKPDAEAVRNGSTFGQQVLGAYAAVKFGAPGAMVRPVLAQA